MFVIQSTLTGELLLDRTKKVVEVTRKEFAEKIANIITTRRFVVWKVVPVGK